MATRQMDSVSSYGVVQHLCPTCVSGKLAQEGPSQKHNPGLEGAIGSGEEGKQIWAAATQCGGWRRGNVKKLGRATAARPTEELFVLRLAFERRKGDELAS